MKFQKNKARVPGDEIGTHTRPVETAGSKWPGRNRREATSGNKKFEKWEVRAQVLPRLYAV